MKYLLLLITIAIMSCGTEPEECEPVQKFDSYCYIPFNGVKVCGFETIWTCGEFSTVGARDGYVLGVCEKSYIWLEG